MEIPVGTIAAERLSPGYSVGPRIAANTTEKATKTLEAAGALCVGFRGCSWGLGPQRDRGQRRNGPQEDRRLCEPNDRVSGAG
jgi:hypothetical protein